MPAVTPTAPVSVDIPETVRALSTVTLPVRKCAAREVPDAVSPTPPVPLADAAIPVPNSPIELNEPPVLLLPVPEPVTPIPVDEVPKTPLPLEDVPLNPAPELLFVKLKPLDEEDTEPEASPVSVRPANVGVALVRISWDSEAVTAPVEPEKESPLPLDVKLVTPLPHPVHVPLIVKSWSITTLPVVKCAANAPVPVDEAIKPTPLIPPKAVAENTPAVPGPNTFPPMPVPPEKLFPCTAALVDELDVALMPCPVDELAAIASPLDVFAMLSAFDPLATLTVITLPDPLCVNIAPEVESLNVKLGDPLVWFSPKCTVNVLAAPISVPLDCASSKFCPLP